MNNVEIIDLKNILPIKDSWMFYKTDNAQIVDWTINSDIILRIILPDEVLEWFVEIYNSHKIKLIDEWYEVYGKKSIELLQMELKKEIEGFCKNIADNETRFTSYRRGIFLYKKFQSFDTNTSSWKDVIIKKEIKLFIACRASGA